MRILNYTLYIKLILLTVVFALNNLTAVAMPEAEVLEAQVAIDDSKQKLTNNGITEENTLTVSQQADEKKQVVATTSDAVALEVDSTDKQDVDSKSITSEDKKPSSEEIASDQTSEDTEKKQTDENKSQEQGLVIENSYISINPGENAAAYLTIKNSTNTDMRLVEVIAENHDLVKKIEIHDNRKINKLVKMVHKKDGFKVKANSELKLKEGGKHIMLFGISKEFFNKEKNIELTLKFMRQDKNSTEIIQSFDIKKSKCKKCCSE